MPAVLHTRFPQIVRELRPRVEKAVEEGAELIAREAKSRVPVESGDLRDAIHVDDDPQGSVVVAGTDEVFYGHMVEFGTSHSAASPFLVPAGEAKRSEIDNLIKAALRRL